MTNPNRVLLSLPIVAIFCAGMVYQTYSFLHCTKSKARTEKVVNEEQLAIDLCTPLVPDQLEKPDQATVVGKPSAQLVDHTWLVTGYVDVPNQKGVLYRRRWACGVIISASGTMEQHKVQFVTVDQSGIMSTQPAEVE